MTCSFCERIALYRSRHVFACKQHKGIVQRICRQETVSLDQMRGDEERQRWLSDNSMLHRKTCGGRRKGVGR